MWTTQPQHGDRSAPLGVRLAGAFAGACMVVLTLTLFASWLIKLFDEPQDEDTVLAHPVDLLSGYSSVDLKELLGEPRYQLPELAPPPPMPVLTEKPQRMISGFVMVEVDVDASGNASTARVINATPAGIYEQQAIDEALAGDYPAGAPGTRDALVRFSVPAEDAP